MREAVINPAPVSALTVRSITHLLRSKGPKEYSPKGGNVSTFRDKGGNVSTFRDKGGNVPIPSRKVLVRAVAPSVHPQFDST